ncbi:hypothetical protein ZWY2020_007927 [Hordeum vulgare]|nr:hypothetical protein ZWY2020_007927 [Hordeum vulgare]
MFGELVVLAITYMVLHYLTGVILRAKRAPLPLPPGPRGYPVVGALPLLGRAPHRALAALARLHGPIMHLTLGRQGLVVASTPESARLLLKDHGGSFLDRPVDDAAPMVLAYGAQDIVFAPYGPKWRRLRRECSAGLLGSKALDDWADTRHEEVGRMVRAMSRRGEALEVPEFLFGAMANMIGQAVVGRRVLDEDDGEATREFQEMVVELMTTAGLVNIGDFVPAVAWMDLQGLGRRMRRLTTRLDRAWSRLLVDHEVAMANRKQEGNRRTDLVDRLIACRGYAEEDGVTDFNIKAVLNVRTQSHLGYYIPKGTRLVVNIWAIGRDPAVWPEPGKFDPGRFMTEEGRKVEPMGSHFELIPFGAGRRMCAGARMGVALVEHMLGALVHAFDWEIPEGATAMDMEEEFGLALQKKVPVRAIVRPRLAPSAYE